MPNWSRSTGECLSWPDSDGSIAGRNVFSLGATTRSPGPADGSHLARCFRRRRRTDRRHRTRAPTRPLRAASRAAPGPLPFRGSTRLTSLSSPSQVPCQSSPSTQVTPVTTRLDSMVRRIAPVSGSIWWIFRPRCCPTQSDPFGPREPGVTAAAGRRDRGEHTAGLRIDLLDAILGDLKQVLAVEGRSGMRGDIDRAHRLPARRIEGVQLVSGREPDVLTVKRDPMHLVDTRKGSIFTEDFGC